ncbi:MAG: DUF2092 domain-containing protein [bacterium]
MLQNSRFVLSALLLISLTAVAESSLDPDDLLRQAEDYMSEASSFSVHVEKRFDVVLSDGTKVEYSGALDVVVDRPLGLFMDYGDDLSAKRVWYDGETLTLLDPLSNFYATAAVEGTVAEALDLVARDLGMVLPLASLLRQNLVEDLESVTTASHLGIHDAEGDPCHHLLFRDEHHDLQLWISAGESPLIRKLVLTYWKVEGSPQQSLTFGDWNLETKIEPAVFKAQLPEDAISIEFLPAGGK